VVTGYSSFFSSTGLATVDTSLVGSADEIGVLTGTGLVLVSLIGSTAVDGLGRQVLYLKSTSHLSFGQRSRVASKV
jgi:hypothetical protein